MLHRDKAALQHPLVSQHTCQWLGGGHLVAGLQAQCQAVDKDSRMNDICLLTTLRKLKCVIQDSLHMTVYI